MISNRDCPLFDVMSTAEMDQLTSGASNRIIPILKTLRTTVIFVQTILLSFILFLLPRRRQSGTGLPQSPVKSGKRKTMWKLEEEDTRRRRALAEDVDMRFDTADDDSEVRCQWSTSLFFGARSNALFCRSWFPVAGELK